MLDSIPWGIYIHIPFCKKKCTYCAFYSVAQTKHHPHYIQAVILEAQSRAREMPATPPQTLYIGGGTPSLLPVSDYAHLFEALSRIWDLSRLQEITMEINPDQVTPDYLQDLKRYTPVRRISMGVQSFIDRDLKWMGRTHNAATAHQAIAQILKVFQDLSIDLIYHLPELTSEEWSFNLQQIEDYNIPHFSAYALSVEPQTILAHKIDKGLITSAPEERLLEQHRILMDWIEETPGWEAYEISNFAKNRHYGLHNRHYWEHFPYLGLGAGAHSFLDKERTRMWNLPDVEKYIRHFVYSSPLCIHESERLSIRDLYHEYIMLALRTSRGISLDKIQNYPPDLQNDFHRITENLVEKGWLQQNQNQLFIPREHRLLTDGIAAEYF